MNWHRHPRAADIVRRHWREAEAFIVAQREPCITIRDDELRHVGDNRILHGGLPDDLEAWERPTSWFLAVVVCPGDDTKAITKYVLAAGLDPARVHFYLHEDATAQALAPWRDAGLPLDRVTTTTEGGRPIRDWGSLHKVLGMHFNVQIVEDFLDQA